MPATAIAAPLFSWPLGPGVVLVPRTPLLAEAYHQLVVANLERLATWEPWALSRQNLQATRTFLEESGQAWLAGTEVPTAIAVRADDGPWRLVGSVTLRVDPSRRSAELGYWVDGGHEGRGLVTAGAGALLTHAFGALGLERASLHARADNVRSRAVATRLGFVEEGVARAAVAYPTRRYDEVGYGLLAAEWPGPPAAASRGSGR